MGVTKKEIFLHIQTTLSECGHAIPLKDVQSVVEALLETMKKQISVNDVISIPSFGCFRKLSKSERPGRNMQTGESLMIAPRSTVSFRMSRQWRESLNSAVESFHNEC